MHSVKQLMRQPGKTAAGIVLAALAVAVLVVSLGQNFAARQTFQSIQHDFSTIALQPRIAYNYEYSGLTFTKEGMSEDMAAWVQQTLDENPHMVKGYSYTTLASAYMPDLIQDHYMLHGVYPHHVFPRRFQGNQDGAMFVVTLESIEEDRVYYGEERLAYNSQTGKTELVFQDSALREGNYILHARIDRVLSLNSVHADPTGWPITLELTCYSQEELDSMELQVGQQYAVAGLDYEDCTHYLYESLEDTIKRNNPQEKFDPAKIHIITQEEIDRMIALDPSRKDREPLWFYGDIRIFNGKYLQLPGWEDYEDLLDTVHFLTSKSPSYQSIGPEQSYHTAKMTVRDFTQQPCWEITPEGVVAQDWRFVTQEGQQVKIPLEEYYRLYSVPTIAKWEGSPDAFFAANPQWAQALDYQQLNRHTFPFYCVDHLNYILDFNRGTARLTQGRMFSQEELTNGEKVCVISELVAEANGLEIGDTISPQFYSLDYNIPYQYTPSQFEVTPQNRVVPSYKLSNPAYIYPGTVYEEPETYTVVGIYRQSNIWERGDANSYSFTPNAIFVPKASVTAPVDNPTRCLFKVLVLENGVYPEFDAIINSKEFPEWAQFIPKEDRQLFVYSDQGYMQVRDSFDNYQTLGRKVMALGAVVFGVILALFTVLYPLSQKKTLRTMASLGTDRKKRIGHLLLSSLGIWIPGTVAGGALGLLLWEQAAGMLAQRSDLGYSLSLHPGTVAAIGAIQLALAFGVFLALSLPLSAPKNLLEKK